MTEPDREAALLDQIRSLEDRLAAAAEAVDILEAIRTGAVDALVIEGEEGTETYTLRSADQPYRVLVQEIGEGALIASADGLVLFQNRAARELLGHTFMGEGLADRFAPSDRGDLAALFSDEGGTLDVTLPPTDENSLRMDARLSVRPMYYDGERRFAVIMTDLSQHNKLIASQAANIAKAQFLALLGHEIRNPLGSIRAALSVLADAPHPDIDKQMRLVASRQVSQIAALVDDLLDLSRIDQGKLQVNLERTELCSLLAACAEPHRVAADEQGISFTLNIGNAELWADVDTTRFQQTIDNLIRNAFDAVADDGIVRLSIRRHPDADAAMIEIEDNGRGISAAELERIFEPFEQVDNPLRPKRGLGLGLPLTRGLVAAQQGTLRAHSEGVNKGAAFEISFQLQVPAAKSVVKGRKNFAPSRPLKILVVDDHEDTTMAMQMLLRADKHDVAVAYTAADAMATVENEMFDVILSDIGLPDEDGVSLGRRLRQEAGYEGVLLAITGFADDEMMNQLTSAGFEARFSKPVDLAKLRNYLNEIPRAPLPGTAPGAVRAR